MGAELSGLGAALKGALRLVYPPQCLGCGAAVAEEGGLCGPCWREADFITGAACGRLGDQPLRDRQVRGRIVAAAELDQAGAHQAGKPSIASSLPARSRAWSSCRCRCIREGC